MYCDKNRTESFNNIQTRNSYHSNTNNKSSHDTINFQHPNRFKNLAVDEDDIPVNNVTQKSRKDPTLKTRPHIITQAYPENNFVHKPVKPGFNNYNQAVKEGKTTVIFSTSITKGINVRDFNKNYQFGTGRFRRFHGAKAKYIKHYVIPTLIDEHPQVVLLQSGGNDLPTTKINPLPVENIANDILDTAKLCENYGAQQILISGIITRKQGYMDRRRDELNNLLKDMCYENGYTFIDNDNITRDHLCYDEVHLNNEGSYILYNNYLHSLNNLF